MRQKNLVLILARDLADKLASAAFVVDHEGTLVYFNERAGEILGKTFAEAGEMTMAEWTTAFFATGQEGMPMDPADLPLVIALRDRRPAHHEFRIKGADGELRDISVTALPLFARRDELVGAMALFWEQRVEAG